MYEDLEELCEVLSEELHEVKEKLHGGNMSSGDLEYIDKLTHALKSVTILKAMEEGESYDEAAYEGRSNRRGRSYTRSNRRRRDSMGRYSKDEDIMSELEELADNTADPQTREEIKKFMRTMGGR